MKAGFARDGNRLPASRCEQGLTLIEAIVLTLLLAIFGLIFVQTTTVFSRTRGQGLSGSFTSQLAADK